VLGRRFVNGAAANDRFQYVHVRDVFGWDFERVAIKDDEICDFTDLQGAGDVVFVEFIGGVNRGGSQNRFAREARVFSQLTVEFRWGAGRIRACHTDLQGKSFVERIHGPITAEGDPRASGCQ
jgi:hypothetical protein